MPLPLALLPCQSPLWGRRWVSGKERPGLCPGVSASGNYGTRSLEVAGSLLSSKERVLLSPPPRPLVLPRIRSFVLCSQRSLTKETSGQPASAVPAPPSDMPRPPGPRGCSPPRRLHVSESAFQVVSRWTDVVTNSTGDGGLSRAWDRRPKGQEYVRKDPLRSHAERTGGGPVRRNGHLGPGRLKGKHKMEPWEQRRWTRETARRTPGLLARCWWLEGSRGQGLGEGPVRSCADGRGAPAEASAAGAQARGDGQGHGWGSR